MKITALGRSYAGLAIGLLSFVVMSCYLSPFAEGQGQATEAVDLKWVELTKKPTVAAGKGGKGWTVTVAGKAGGLPKGTRARFLLTWRSQTIYQETISLDGGSFSE